MTAILLSLNMIVGCAYLKTPAVSELVPVPEPTSRYEVLQLKNEIKQLQKVMKKKDALIREQHTHQQNQAEAQQNASDEVVKVQVKLHRLATKPSAASTIAEAEVAMESVKQDQTLQSDQVLQLQAQHLLDAALGFYEHDDYVAAMNYAAQAHEYINMIADKNRKMPYSSRKTVSIHTQITLQAIADINLREEPHNTSTVVNVLKKGAILITNTYRGDWLRVQTDDGRQGWVLNTLVATVVNNP